MSGLFMGKKKKPQIDADKRRCLNLGFASASLGGSYA